MMNEFKIFDPPLGPQPINDDLYSRNTQTMIVSDRIFRPVAYDALIQTTDGKHVFSISKTPTSASRTRFSVSSALAGHLFSFRQSSNVLTKYMTDLAMDRGTQLRSRARIWGPKADLTFSNASDDLRYDLEVDGDWRSDIIQIHHVGRSVATIAKLHSSRSEATEIQLKIAPQVDISMLLFVMISLEDRQHQTEQALGMHRFDAESTLPDKQLGRIVMMGFDRLVSQKHSIQTGNFWNLV